MKIPESVSFFYESNLAEPIRIFLKNKMAVIGLAILVLFLLIAVFAPLLATHDPTTMNRLDSGRPARLQPPSLHFLFGTTDLGRDVYSRL